MARVNLDNPERPLRRVALNGVLDADYRVADAVKRAAAFKAQRE